MSILSNIVLFLALAAAVVFSLLVLLTGKGDAMSGGGSVRTNYKGKATFDDIMSRAALILGISFMGLVLIYSVISKRVMQDSMKTTPITNQMPISAPPASNNAPATTGSNNAPAVTPPASNNAPATTASTNTPAVTPPAANNAPASNNAPAK